MAYNEATTLPPQEHYEGVRDIIEISSKDTKRQKAHEKARKRSSSRK
jgi:hypothetical protein